MNDIKHIIQILEEIRDGIYEANDLKVADMAIKYSNLTTLKN